MSDTRAFHQTEEMTRLPGAMPSLLSLPLLFPYLYSFLSTLALASELRVLDAEFKVKLQFPALSPEFSGIEDNSDERFLDSLVHF